jgi:hypothetical protein
MDLEFHALTALNRLSDIESKILEILEGKNLWVLIFLKTRIPLKNNVQKIRNYIAEFSVIQLNFLLQLLFLIANLICKKFSISPFQFIENAD